MNRLSMRRGLEGSAREIMHKWPVAVPTTASLQLSGQAMQVHYGVLGLLANYTALNTYTDDHLQQTKHW